MRLLVDGRVCDRAFAVIQGAETEESVRVKNRDLVKLTGALLVDLCHDRPGRGLPPLTQPAARRSGRAGYNALPRPT